jgi:hypothetical protein
MNFSNKIIVFLLGLSLGLLVGAGFFIFKIDDYISKMELFKSAPDTTIILTQNSIPYNQKPRPDNGSARVIKAIFHPTIPAQVIHLNRQE